MPGASCGRRPERRSGRRSLGRRPLGVRLREVRPRTGRRRRRPESRHPRPDCLRLHPARAGHPDRASRCLIRNSDPVLHVAHGLPFDNREFTSRPAALDRGDPSLLEEGDHVQGEVRHSPLDERVGRRDGSSLLRGDRRERAPTRCRTCPPDATLSRSGTRSTPRSRARSTSCPGGDVPARFHPRREEELKRAAPWIVLGLALLIVVAFFLRRDPREELARRSSRPAAPVAESAAPPPSAPPESGSRCCTGSRPLGRRSRRTAAPGTVRGLVKITGPVPSEEKLIRFGRRSQVRGSAMERLRALRWTTSSPTRTAISSGPSST